MPSTPTGEVPFSMRGSYLRGAGGERCKSAVFIEKCSAAVRLHRIRARVFQCAPKRSDWVAMRTSMKNAPNAAVRHTMAATNKMATAPDKLIEMKADAKSDITTSDTNSADIVQS